MPHTFEEEEQKNILTIFWLKEKWKLNISWLINKSIINHQTFERSKEKWKLKISWLINKSIINHQTFERLQIGTEPNPNQTQTKPDWTELSSNLLKSTSLWKHKINNSNGKFSQGKVSRQTQRNFEKIINVARFILEYLNLATFIIFFKISLSLTWDLALRRLSGHFSLIKTRDKITAWPSTTTSTALRAWPEQLSGTSPSRWPAFPTFCPWTPRLIFYISKELRKKSWVSLTI